MGVQSSEKYGRLAVKDKSGDSCLTMCVGVVRVEGHNATKST